MNNYKQLEKEEIPCVAYHKGLSYAEVNTLTFKGNEVFYNYRGPQLRHHSRWASIKHFVTKTIV